MWSVLCWTMEPNLTLPENGPTPLMEAAVGGHVSIVRLLLDHGADVNAKSRFVWKKVKIIGEKCSDLKQPGAKEELCDNQDCWMTPLCVATDPSVRDLLIEGGGTE